MKDDFMWATIDRHPAACVAWYLCASFLYYHCDISVLSDGAFDELSNWMLRNWEKWQDHPHSSYVSKEDLKAGTCLMGWDDFPNITIGAAGRLAERVTKEMD